MSTADDEAVIAKYYANEGHGKPDIVAAAHVPGLYYVDGWRRMLVHGGKIVDGGGLDAASAFMRAVKLLERKPEALELTTILTSFEALPPIGDAGYTAEAFQDSNHNPKLKPSLEIGPDGGKLVLCYLVGFPHGGGGLPNPNLRRLFRWTLTIAKDYKLAWRDDETTFNIATQEIGRS